MANINLKRFVDVNIEKHTDSAFTGTRDTVVLYTPDGEKDTKNLITSYSEALAKYSNKENTLAYLKVFFDNGGAKVLVVEGYAYSALTADIIKELEDKYILIAAVVPIDNVSDGYTKLKEIATTRATDTTIYGVNEKFILARTNANDATTVENFCVKYSNVLGAEMAIAAYLTRIDVYGQDTVRDYMFTQEVLTPEVITDDTYETIINNNMNIDIELANATRNCGGNCKDGSDITNTYVRIILHQTLTNKLLVLLTEKIKGGAGISKIYNAISQELNSYLTCGYLTTDKTWTDDNLVVNYNDEQYTIIEKNTALTNGYYVKVLPFTALTDADKASRKAPPIYVIIADQYTIRQITIVGEVI